MIKSFPIVIAFFIPLICYTAEPQEKYGLFDRIRGSFLKTLAKTYVATTNLEKFKEKHLGRIREMDEAKFKRVYAKIYNETMLHLPQSIRDQYGVREDLSKREAIDLIDSFDTKKKIYQVINSLPSGFVGKQRREKAVEKKEEVPKEEKLRKNEVDKYFDFLLEDPGPAVPVNAVKS